MTTKLKYRLAELGYNMGYGAKRQFASYDLVEKFPFYFSVFIFFIGVYGLSYPGDSIPRWLSIGVLVSSYAMTYVNSYSKNKEEFVLSGKAIQKCYGKIRNLYLQVEEKQVEELLKEIENIEMAYHDISLHKQVFFSDIYAHYKLFGESQSDWFVKELKLTFWKDMIPAAIKKFLFIGILFLVSFVIYNSNTLTKVLNCINNGSL